MRCHFATFPDSMDEFLLPSIVAARFTSCVCIASSIRLHLAFMNCSVKQSKNLTSIRAERTRVNGYYGLPVDVERQICFFPSQSLKINLARLRFSLQFFLSLMYWLSFLDFPPMRDFSSLLYRNALRKSHSRFCRLVQGKDKKKMWGGRGG